MSVNSDRLQLYLNAESAILSGQQVRMGDRQLTMADLATVRAGIAELQRAVANETSGTGGGFKAVDFRAPGASDPCCG